MSKFGWSLPPGCSQSDIDRAAGITPEAEAEEDINDKMWTIFAAHLDPSNEEDWRKVCDFVWVRVNEAYKLGYDQGQSDAHLALQESGQ